jgi:hypothetical protein
VRQPQATSARGTDQKKESMGARSPYQELGRHNRFHRLSLGYLSALDRQNHMIKARRGGVDACGIVCLLVRSDEMECQSTVAALVDLDL